MHTDCSINKRNIWRYQFFFYLENCFTFKIIKMKKLLFVFLTICFSNVLFSQTTSSKTTAENNAKSIYPDAVFEENDNTFYYDAVSKSAKVSPSQVGKVKVLDQYYWVEFYPDGTICQGITTVFVHTFLGFYICAGHIVNVGGCN